MNAAQKIDATTGERAEHQGALENLRAALDTAANAGDLAEVKRVQVETTALQELVASCDRRIAKLQADLIEEQKEAQRKTNGASLAKFKAAARRLPPRAHKLGEIVAELAAELAAFHADAREATDAAYDLVVQAETVRSHDYLHLCAYTSFNDNVLGHCLGDEMRKAGIFSRLAPHSSRLFERLDLPPIGECIESRVENLTKRVEHAFNAANSNTKPV